MNARAQNLVVVEEKVEMAKKVVNEVPRARAQSNHGFGWRSDANHRAVYSPD